MAHWWHGPQISLALANRFYAWGWRASIMGAVITAAGVLFLFWGTRVRDHDSEVQFLALNKEAADARERAGKLEAASQEMALKVAEANQKAEAERVGRLKLELRLAPRSLTPTGMQVLVGRLRGFAGVGVDLIPFAEMGADANRLAQQLRAGLSAAGMSARIFTPTSSGAHVGGILVRTATNATPLEMQAAAELVIALNEAGVSAGPWAPFPQGEPPAIGYHGPGFPDARVRILIGGKV